MRKVFTKLGITSRTELIRDGLPSGSPIAATDHNDANQAPRPWAGMPAGPRPTPGAR